MKKFITILISLMVVFAFTSCGEPEEEAQTEFGINETATFNDVNYTITDMETSNGGEWDDLKDGNEYVIVTVKIENKSEETVSYNTYDWKMLNDEGQLDETTYMSDVDDISSGDLAPGGKKTGKLIFEEPKSSKTLVLHYYDNSLFDDESAFQFKLR